MLDAASDARRQLEVEGGSASAPHLSSSSLPGPLPGALVPHWRMVGGETVCFLEWAAALAVFGTSVEFNKGLAAMYRRVRP